MVHGGVDVRLLPTDVAAAASKDAGGRTYTNVLAVVLEAENGPDFIVRGERALGAINGLGQPLSEPLAATVGVIQRWTPSVEALYVPDIDESLDEQGAKRRFWDAFRVLGEWHERQAPF